MRTRNVIRRTFLSRENYRDSSALSLSHFIIVNSHVNEHDKFTERDLHFEWKHGLLFDAKKKKTFAVAAIKQNTTQIVHKQHW